MDLKIAVVMLNWNAWPETVECLKILGNTLYDNLHIFVLDNGSGNDSYEQLQSWLAETWYCNVERTGAKEFAISRFGKKVTLLHSGQNLGFAGGVNFILQYILQNDDSFEYFLLLNNDVRVDAAFFTEMVKTAQQSSAAIVGALIKSYDGRQVQFARNYFPQQLYRPSTKTAVPGGVDFWDTDETNGSAMMLTGDFVRQCLQERSFVLDPQLFLYCEETELCRYAWQQGLACVVSKQAVAYHKLSNSSGGEGNPRTYYYLTRNRVYLARKLLSPRQLALFHLVYPVGRIMRAITKIFAKRGRVAVAIVAGLLDGYCQRMGQWHKHGGYIDG
ncbi:nucleotide-diphospho-sugar transferases [Lucifera butyrica]|uniref:Nucleotide-diphospho-sugar transferases n=1 Tax=Lucifera butyrica TaxID=1351585 RepID=A0A498RH38_9FIRM|nr:glycosyltransferase family 2 protein [Lucifera butyrica]VBB09402.1 nucleotide-diphospho-sugar transferases [Lucifera butyrica]